jgi:hypothetical protein
VPENITQFSKHFVEALGESPPVDIGRMDEFINQRLEAEDGLGPRAHKQMVQLDKRVITPFLW